MTQFRVLLGVQLVCILVYTSVTIAQHGTNLVPLFFGEIAGFGWQGQFNLDFLMFLLLSGLWTAWRGGFTAASLALGVVATVLGILFLSTYLLYLSFKTGGDPRRMLLGVHAYSVSLLT